MSAAVLLAHSREAFDGAAEWLGNRLRRLPALLASALVGSAGALFLAGLMVTLGLFTTEALLSISRIAEVDANVLIWLGSHRTPFLTDASYIGSKLADAPVLVPLVGVFVLALVLRRRWMRATFLALAAMVEVWGYVLTSGFVQWRSTNTAGQDSFPWESFPAGHVAAAIAIYGALAIVLTAHLSQWWARSVVWVVAVAIALAVAASRMYRGDHHLLDLAGGAAMGLGALFVALLAEQVARIVRGLRSGKFAGEVAR
jgi:membrane-associated phospholipid phosphatase